MAATAEKLLEEALALPTDERARLVAKLSASLVAPSGAKLSLLALTGRGRGLWGDDSSATLDRLRDEWR